nr:MAG TPA: hypothetical protein [Caudoviricetes sp.]DAW27352.1 MAG TPA: hypothetical protein [Caudoviricetes sp.]
MVCRVFQSLLDACNIYIILRLNKYYPDSFPQKHIKVDCARIKLMRTYR